MCHRPFRQADRNSRLDWWQSLSPNEHEIFFSKAYEVGGHVAIYSATRDSIDQPFSEPEYVDELNDDFRQGQVSLSSDGRSIFFYRRSESGPGEIFTATRATTNDPFEEPTLLFGSPDRQFSYFAPRVSADGKSLYVQARSAPGDAENDIHVSHWRASPGLQRF